MKKKNLEEIKRLILIVDGLNGFIRGGKLADKTVAHIIPEIVRLIEDTLQDPEVMHGFIKDCHEHGCREFKTFPEHCLKGTWEAELIDEFKPYEKDGLVYYKNSTSAIFAPGFLEDIKKMINLMEVIIVGWELDICDINLGIPLKNFFDQYNKNVEVIIPVNAVETFDGPGHNREEYTDMALKLMKQSGLKLVKKYERSMNYGK